MPRDKFPRIAFKQGTLGASLFNDEQDRLILVEGAITTPGLFARFEGSLAHVYNDGLILRHGHPIGTRDDLEFLDD